MSEEILTDEGLVEAYRLGEASALDVLLKRYEPRWRNLVLYLSWRKDASFIDDIIQLILVAIWKGIIKGGFDAGKGSFKQWAEGIGRNICQAENRKDRRQPQPLSEMYPEEFPDDLMDTRPDISTKIMDLERSKVQLAKILQLLTPEEQELFRLMSQDKTYKDIQQIPPFNKYTLVNLRRKVCDLREFLYKEVMKWQKAETR